MIDVKELRIGNFVNILGKPTKITAIQISNDNLGCLGADLYGSVTQNQVEPIELTKEILLKCGFKRRTENDRDVYCVRGMVDFWKPDIKYYTEYDGRLNIIARIKNQSATTRSLHHLQNLYFALTGEELKIKLKL